MASTRVYRLSLNRWKQKRLIAEIVSAAADYGLKARVEPLGSFGRTRLRLTLTGTSVGIEWFENWRRKRERLRS